MEKERTLMWEKNIDRLPPVHTPAGDLTCDMSYVPRSGIEPVTFPSTGRDSNQLSHPSQGCLCIFKTTLYCGQHMCYCIHFVVAETDSEISRTFPKVLETNPVSLQSATQVLLNSLRFGENKTFSVIQLACSDTSAMEST